MITFKEIMEEEVEQEDFCGKCIKCEGRKKTTHYGQPIEEMFEELKKRREEYYDK